MGSAGTPTPVKGGGGLSGGAIAGIVVGVLGGIALIALLALYLTRRRRRMLPVSLPSGVKRHESSQGMLHPDPASPNAVSRSSILPPSQCSSTSRHQVNPKP